MKKLHTDFSSGEPREFIDLLSFCSEHKITRERLEETVRRLLGYPCQSLTVEKLRALPGNSHQAPALKTGDSISRMAQKQLSRITQLTA